MRYLRRQRHTLYRHVSRLPLHKPVGLWRYSRRTQIAIIILVVLGTSIPATLFRPLFAHANSIGPNNPTAASGTSWTSPANVYASDGAYASYAISAGGTSTALNVTGFGFSIPTGSTINGIQVDIEDYAPSNSKAKIEDSNVQLLLAGAATGSNLGLTTTVWPTAEAYTTYGSSSNLWGTTPATTDINNTGFGVTITAKNVKSGGGASNTAYIDHVRITVTYTPPPTTYNQASYRLFQNQDASGAEVGGFQADGTVSPGTNPFGAAIADFNGDGHMDIATANSGAASVGILFGDGTGGFSLSSSPAVGTAPYNIVTADFNGDGHPDLAVTNFSSGTVSILLNNGSGGFSVSSTITVGASPYGLVAADFNGDGKPDLAVANSGANTVSILLNNGSGGFSVSSSPAVGTTPYGITAADFDGDGHIDLAVVNDGGSTVSILHNSGSGSFTLASSPAVGSSPYYIVTGDFNGDGHPDLAVTNDSTGSVSILLNNGSGGFNVSTGPSVNTAMGITLGDFNGDGKPDLAVTSNTIPGAVTILLNNGSGSFTTSSTVSAGSSTRNIAAGDFNGDGKPDLVALNNIDSTGSIFLNAFSAPIDVGSPLAAQNTAATSPGDGQPFRMRMDVGVSTSSLAANGQTFKLQYAPMTTSCDTSFTNTPSSAYSDVTDTTTVHYYDNPVATSGGSLTIDTNDPSDGTNTTANGNVIPETYQEKGTTTFTNPTAIPSGDDSMWDFALTTSGTSGGQHYCLRIVTSSGTTLNTYTAIPEIIIPPTSLSQASYRFFNNQDATGSSGGTGTFGASTNYTTGDDVYGAALGDFNGDGKMDIATVNAPATPSVSVLLNSGTGTFPSHTEYPVGTSDYPVAIAVADLNGDGKPDIVTVSNTSTGNVSVLLNNGNGTFGTYTDYTGGSYPMYIAVGDVNGDGKPDIVTADANASGTVSVFLNSGTGTFPSHTDYTTGANPTGVSLGDVNGDGKLDIVTADNNASGTVSVLLNSGTGTFPSHTDYTTGTTPAIVVVADLNGDGKPDIVTADNTSPGLASVLLNSGTGTFPSHTDYTVDAWATTVAVADLNGDGKPDIVTSQHNTANTVSVLLNTGSGTFGTNTNYTTGTSPESVSVGDVNGDSIPDIVTGDYSVPGAVSVLLGQGSTPSVGVGAALAAQNTAATSPGDGQPFRLRLDVGVSSSGIASSGQNFKLQYAPMTTSCDTGFTNTPSSAYSDVTDTSTVQYYDNPVASNGDTLTTSANDPSDGTNTTANGGVVPQTYQEKTTTTFTDPTAITAGQDGMWDFALTTSGTSGGQHYCLRVVTSSGSALNTYADIPEIVMPGSSNTAPNSPTALAQAKTDNTTIPTGGWINATSVKFSASATDPDASDTEQLCVEAEPLGTAFTNTETLCGTGVAYSGTAVTVSVTLTGLTDATQYHWQARVKDAGGLYSGWVSYGGNAESASDYGIDTTAPIGGTVYDGTTPGVDASYNDGSLSALSANWSGIDATVSGLAGYEYSIGTSPGATDVVGWTSNGTATAVTASGLSLHTSNKYFFNVRTTDNAGNQSVISSDGQYVSPSVSFSVSPSVVTFNKLNASNSYTDTKATTLTTSTNAYGGYVIRGLMTDLLRSGSNKTIPDFTGGTYAAPDSWQPGDVGFGYTSSDTNVQGVNKFQAATCPGGSALTAPGCYAPFSHTNPGDIVADDTNAVSGTPITNEQFTITYRITTTSTQPATTYNASAVYSITPIY